MSVELRLSDVDPPELEPKRTIYRDIVNLPDPVKLGITIRYFNHDDVGLYMQITGSGTGYTFGAPVNLGLLASGANNYKNLDEFASRAKPSVGDLPDGEMEENVTLILRGYTDAGYANLKWTFERVVTVHWINSVDLAFTVDELDNFDDGTIQGWAVFDELGNYPTPDYPKIAAVVDYILSPPYSARMEGYRSAAGTGELRSRLYKSFTTPNKPQIFAVFNVRTSTSCHQKYMIFSANGTTLVFIGKPYNTATVNDFPINKWMRVVVPLPKDTTLEIRIIHDFYPPGVPKRAYLWLDDFMIISK